MANYIVREPRLDEVEAMVDVHLSSRIASDIGHESVTGEVIDGDKLAAAAWSGADEYCDRWRAAIGEMQRGTGRLVRVAEHAGSGALTGVLDALPQPGRGTSYYVNALYVSEQGQGIGTSLFKEIRNIEPLAEIWLCVACANDDRAPSSQAQRFYDRLGCCQTGTRVDMSQVSSIVPFHLVRPLEERILPAGLPYGRQPVLCGIGAALRIKAQAEPNPTTWHHQLVI